MPIINNIDKKTTTEAIFGESTPIESGGEQVADRGKSFVEIEVKRGRKL
ncbi:hypothetical protein ACFLY9_01205 [Patescibacteria group bacterium]